MDLEFSKLNLSEGDSLVIKVNTSGLSEDQTIKRLSEVRDDAFLDYVSKKGHKIFITYTGIDLEILRLNSGDKVAAYVDVTPFDEQKKEEYLDYVQNKLSEIEDLIVVPVLNNSPKLKVIKKEETQNG